MILFVMIVILHHIVIIVSRKKFFPNCVPIAVYYITHKSHPEFFVEYTEIVS